MTRPSIPSANNSRSPNSSQTAIPHALLSSTDARDDDGTDDEDDDVSNDRAKQPRLAIHETAPADTQRAIVISRRSDGTDDEIGAHLAELNALLRGLGVDVVHTLTQRRAVQTGPVLGSGKLAELKEQLEFHQPAEWRGPRAPLLIVVDGALTPGQQATFERALDDDTCGPIVVADRVSVILRVFESRAQTPLARLETELARLRYDGPRARDTGETDDDQGGGGGRGARGHTNVELRKGRIKERITQIVRALELEHRSDDARRDRRSNTRVTALVGYTNAGKSSLMRALTGSDVLVEDKLFATLGTTVRALTPAVVPPVLLADTVGFLRALPHELIGSFRSTLREASDANLLLFVVDTSDAAWREHLELTRTTLVEMDVVDIPSIVVFNKVDKIDDDTRRALVDEWPDAVVLSAHDEEGVRALHARIAAHFEQDAVDRVVFVPYAAGKLIGELRATTRVLGETTDDDGWHFTLRGTKSAIAHLVGRVKELHPTANE